jgi:hypothetical protein
MDATGLATSRTSDGGLGLTMNEPQTLATGSLLANELVDVLERGDVKALDRLIEENPGVSGSVIIDSNGDAWRPLHLYANAPGHRPNPAQIVEALARTGPTSMLQ